MTTEKARHMGVWGATLVGVGAIVGGGIFVLAGVAFAAAGPGALVAFAINGSIAALTALSFAEMSSAFPESGGPYNFARRVLSVRAAFGVGWILWFAYIVTTVLYALGFGSYAVEALRGLWQEAGGEAPSWISGRRLALGFALAAAAVYGVSLYRKATGGGQLATIGKVVVFFVLVLGGVWALWRSPDGTATRAMDPLLPFGTLGLVTAMGYTFIAVQGFDLISAMAGEIKRPKRTIPLSMLLSLGLAMAIYLPLIFIIASVGVEGGSIAEMSRANPETVIALAAERYMGRAGYWLVVVAALLSTLSALQANFLVASRVAERMAQDRTLPKELAAVHPRFQTPTTAVLATAVAIGVLLVLIPDLSAAGAAASLIFLVAFSLAHVTAILARRRGGRNPDGFVMPWFPAIPVLGAVACIALAAFQAVAVPAAGGITLAWLGLGGVLYMALFGSRARAVDAHAEARDPSLIKLRGRSPLVLVPVANPATAAGLVQLAHVMAPRAVGRVLLLAVVTTHDAPDGKPPQQLIDAQQSLSHALTRSLGIERAPEALLTVAREAWPEIVRVAEEHRCASLLIGFTQVPDPAAVERLEDLLSDLECDVLVLRAPAGWSIGQVERILVPVAGKGSHSALRARLLGAFSTTGRRATFLRVMPPETPTRLITEGQKELEVFGKEEFAGEVLATVVADADPTAAITRHAGQSDLVVLGLRRIGRRRRVFGDLPLKLLSEVDTPTLMIGHHG